MTFATRSDPCSGHNAGTMLTERQVSTCDPVPPARVRGGSGVGWIGLSTTRQLAQPVWHALLAVTLLFGYLQGAAAQVADSLVFAKTVSGSPLLDGQCKESFWKDIPPTVVNKGEMQLRFAFDGQFVTICVELAEAGLPSVDLFISTPALARSMRLHSSAQVGQAERRTIGWADDIEWGRNDGWYAPPIPIQGMVVRGNLRRPLFATVSQREIQLDTRQFGFGEWRFLLQISGVGSKRAQIRFPDADQSMPDKWATVKILPLKR